MKNYYEILSIPRSASLSEIKASFKKLAVKYHPDKNEGDKQAEEKFKEVNEAYQILSDPDKKYRYDLMFEYTLYQWKASQSVSYDYPVYQQQKRRKPPPFGRFYDPRKERISLYWSFGIVLFIGIVVFTISGVTAVFDNLSAKETQMLNLTLLSQARAHQEAGKYRESLETLSQIDHSSGSDINLIKFKEDILTQVIQKANYNYQLGNFKNASEDYEIVLQYEDFFHEHAHFYLAMSQKFLGEYQNAASILKNTLVIGSSNLLIYRELGAIYSQNLDEEKEALYYYNQAVDLIIKDYSNKYGEAYALVVKPELTPELHYIIHYELGFTYAKMGLFQKALSACKWAQFLRPNNPEIYDLIAKCDYSMGDKDKACREWNVAAGLGMKQAKETMKRYCRS